MRRYKRARLTGLQKRYYAKLYRIGKLKKKPYSQVWKYKDDIRKMEKLQQQYLFLVRHDVHSMEELASTVFTLTDKRKESSAEKSRVYRAKQRYKSLFEIANQMDELQAAEISFQNGDNFFLEEHNLWMELAKRLEEEGYTYEEIKKLREYYKEQIAYVSSKERASTKELKLGKSIWKNMVSEDTEIREEKPHEKTQDRVITKQPER